MRLGPALDVELLERGAVDGIEAGRELLTLARRQRGLDGPVFLALEGLDLGLAVAHEPQRHRLDAAGRAGTGELAPEHGREGKADEVVERPAGKVGGHERGIDLARLAQRCQDRLLRHRIEGDALDLGVLP